MLCALFSSAIIIIVSMIQAPLAGYFIDRIGKRATMMIVGSVVMIPTYFMLGATFVLTPAAMWLAIPLVLKDEHTRTAFGLCTAVQNIYLALFPFLNGLLCDATQDDTAGMLMFAGLGVVGLVFALLLKRADRIEGGILERGGT